jgi:hypothetical protein
MHALANIPPELGRLVGQYAFRPHPLAAIWGEVSREVGLYELLPGDLFPCVVYHTPDASVYFHILRGQLCFKFPRGVFPHMFKDVLSPEQIEEHLAFDGDDL